MLSIPYIGNEKDYERLSFFTVRSMYKNFSHCIPGHAFQFPNIGRKSPAFMIY